MTAPNKPSLATWLRAPSAHCETVPKGDFLPWRIILLGAPGVGKGTQAELLNQRLLACHLSTGDVCLVAATRSDAEQSLAMKPALVVEGSARTVPESGGELGIEVSSELGSIPLAAGISPFTVNSRSLLGLH